MPGTKLLTRHDPRSCLRVAWRAAQDLGYSLTAIDDSSKSFTATKGNAVVGLLAGPLAPHCRFEITVEPYSDANEVILVRNAPWLTSGSVGVNRIKARADELIDAIARAIERDGGAIQERREF